MFVYQLHHAQSSIISGNLCSKSEIMEQSPWPYRNKIAIPLSRITIMKISSQNPMVLVMVVPGKRYRAKHGLTEEPLLFQNLIEQSEGGDYLACIITVVDDFGPMPHKFRHNVGNRCNAEKSATMGGGCQPRIIPVVLKFPLRVCLKPRDSNCNAFICLHQRVEVKIKTS
jgi:hypothetical protein